MKRTLTALLGSILFLSACSAGNEDQPAEEAAPETEQENTEQTGGSSDMLSAELIEGAVENSEGITSYEARQSYKITMPEEETTIRRIMTYGGQNELKLSVSNNDDIITHYVVEDDYLMY